MNASRLARRFIIWHGELTTQGSLWRRGLLYLSPGLIWLILFLVAPGLILVAVSFTTRGAYGEIEWTPTLENYIRLGGFSLFGWTADYLRILWRSVVVAFVTTVLCVVLSYPLCFFITARPERTRYYWLTLVIIPFWTNMVIRTYAWFIILAPGLPWTRLAAFLGFIPEGAPLYPNAFAVYLGMVSMFLPFVALPFTPAWNGWTGPWWKRPRTCMPPGCGSLPRPFCPRPCRGCPWVSFSLLSRPWGCSWCRICWAGPSTCWWAI